MTARICPCDTVRDQQKQLQQSEVIMAEIKKDIQRIDENTKRIEKKFDDGMKMLNDKLDEMLKNPSRDEFQELKAAIDEIKTKPQKRYDAIWGYIVGALIGSGISMLIASISN